MEKMQRSERLESTDILSRANTPPFKGNDTRTPSLFSRGGRRLTPLSLLLIVIVLSSSNASAFSYHDNKVTISLSGSGYSLVSGSFTIDSFSVHSGQDPDGHIKAGLVTNMNSSGGLTFVVGRKGSSNVASFFNGKIPANNNTFGHTAGSLNFAFVGTLTMKLTGGLLAGNVDTFTFTNIGIAQGHSGASNNWWFGGQSCANVSSNHVICTGVNSLGAAITVDFLRGGNSVDVVGVTPSALIETTAWMDLMPDTIPLDQLVLPGTHDAGMSELHHCSFLADFGPEFVQTQSEGVGAQLVDGSRYFDIRVDYDHDVLVTYHRTGSNGCNGQDLSDVLDQTVAFLEAHPSETAILDFSHIRGAPHDKDDTRQRIDDLLDNYLDSMYQNPDPDNSLVNLAGMTLGDVRGKMILTFLYTGHINPSTGRFLSAGGGNDCVTSATANLTVCNKFSNTASYADMQKDQIDKWNSQAELGSGHLFLLSWTLTASNPPFDPSIKTLADQANGNLPGVLFDQLVTKGVAKPNIVFIDFVNSSTMQSILQYNTGVVEAVQPVQPEEVYYIWDNPNTEAFIVSPPSDWSKFTAMKFSIQQTSTNPDPNFVIALVFPSTEIFSAPLSPSTALQEVTMNITSPSTLVAITSAAIHGIGAQAGSGYQILVDSVVLVDSDGESTSVQLDLGVKPKGS